MAHKHKPQEKPSKNRTSSSRQRKGGAAGADDTNQSHRSVNSQIEGGQNEEMGELHYGYGSDQGQSQGGKKQGTTN
jgi:hypothetical protein